MSVLNMRNRRKKLLTILVCLFQELIRLSDAKCRFTYQNCVCKEVDNENFLHEFYNNFQDENAAEKNSLEILGGKWMSIEYFPRIPISNGYYNITSLSINDANARHIDEHAFENLQSLRSLDLSRNQLENTSFVKYLPTSLKSLNLADNRIVNIPFFLDLNLNFLNMRRNRIITLNLTNVCGIDVLDFSQNSIEYLLGPGTDLDNYNQDAIELEYVDEFPFKSIEYDSYDPNPATIINLSKNKIAEFKETKYGLNFQSLDLSFNNLTVLELGHDKHFLNLSNSNVSHFVVRNSDFVCDSIDLSRCECEKNLSESIRVSSKMKSQIKDLPHFENIKSDILNLVGPSSVVDLSYSSIRSFPAHAFRYLNLHSLNLSYLNVSELNGFIFQSAKLHVLDLSHSHIKVLHPNVFDGLDCFTIDLSYSGISDIKNVFFKVNARKIDLSFNAFKAISNNSFESCDYLEVLILSSCSIERIGPQAFIGLKNLQILDLSNNELVILEKNTFHDLPVRDLKLHGNKIKTIQSRAFSGLSTLKSLNLSHVQLHNLEMNAFCDLLKVESIDLSHNDLNVIPPQLFMNTPLLAAVDFALNNISTLEKFPNNLKIEKLTLSLRGTFTWNNISNINVRYLAFEHSTIETLKTDSFKGMYNLEELHFSDSHIGLLESGALNDLYNLRYLDSQNLFRHMERIEGDIFRDLKSLKALNLSGLSLKAMEPNSFRGMKNIRVILLSNNNLIHLKQGTFAGLKTLEVLDASHNQISEFDDGVFSSLSILKELYLQYNKIERLESNYFEELIILEKLHLDHNNIKFLSPDSFLGLQNLKDLHLDHNSLTDLTLGVFQYMPNLGMLNLSHNELEGIETGAFSNLKNLIVLDLSNTSLKLVEADAFVSMKNLKRLSLDGNYLKDFDYERLLVNLTNLRYMGISYNKWLCHDLSIMIAYFNNKNIDYESKFPNYSDNNIDGIDCIYWKYVMGIHNI